MFHYTCLNNFVLNCHVLSSMCTTYIEKSFVIDLVHKGKNNETFHIYIIFFNILLVYSTCAFYLQDIFLNKTL